MTEGEPDALVRSAQALLVEQQAGLDELARLLAAVPGLLRDSALGVGSSPPALAVELIHGPDQQREFWQQLVTQRPHRPLAIVPDLRTVLELVLGGQAIEASRDLGAAGVRSRVLTAAQQLADPRFREEVARLTELGIEIRTASSIPSFLLLEPGRWVVLPLEWGQSTPATLVVVRDPSLVNALEASYDDLWNRAVPLPTADRQRQQVLSLMAQGLADAAIAESMGISVRSVRRRIADAAEEWGVGTRFALGIEWARGRR